MSDLEACSLEWVRCLIKVIYDCRSYLQLVVFYLLTVLLFLLYCWFAAVVTKNHKTLPKSVGTLLNPQMQPRQLMAFVVVHSLSHVRLFATPWTAVHQAPLSSTISQTLLKFMSIELVVLSNHLILCHPLLLLPSVFPTIRVFSSELALLISISASASASVLPVNTQCWFLLGLTVWSPCCPKDSQASSPAPSSFLE